MVRYLIAAFVGCLYVAGSVWLVQTEGRAYRQSLGRAGNTDMPIPGLSIEQPRIEAEVAAVDRVSKPSPAGLHQPPEKPNLELQPSRAKKPVDEPSLRSPMPVAADGVQPQSSVPPSQPRAQVPGTNPPPAPRSNPDRKLDRFWTQDFLTKIWDVDHLTVQDEISLGDQFHDLILQTNPPDNGSSHRVKQAAGPFIELGPENGTKYQFTVLNSDVPNAFSHPSGYIYISRKLLDMIAEEEDYVLEFVVGHEMAHLELHHALQVLRNPGVRKYTDGTLQKLYFLIIPHAYTDELEFAADAWIYQRMKRLQRSEHDCMAFLRKLERYAEANDIANGRGRFEDLIKDRSGKPDTARVASPIDNHLRAHPAASERLGRLKKLRDQAAGATK